MVLRYCLTTEPEVVRDTFGYHNNEEFPPRDGIWPGQPIVIVRNSHAQRREAVLVRWGLVPSWVRDFDKLGMLSTARIETVLEKASFRGGMRHKRCLIPASGYFLWRGPTGRKQSYIAELIEKQVFGIAGIYEQWMGADGSEIDSAAILTRRAKGVSAGFTERMPIILGESDFESWLDCRNYSAKEALELVGSKGIDELRVSVWPG
ncbi:MAG: SOS response-associated peptidase [Pseudomonadota bacterium]